MEHGDADRHESGDRGELGVGQALKTLAAALAIGTGLFVASRGIVSETDLDRATALLQESIRHEREERKEQAAELKGKARRALELIRRYHEQ